jgi:hypothetical protein
MIKVHPILCAYEVRTVMKTGLWIDGSLGPAVASWAQSVGGGWRASLEQQPQTSLANGAQPPLLLLQRELERVFQLAMCLDWHKRCQLLLDFLRSHR